MHDQEPLTNHVTIAQVIHHETNRVGLGWMRVGHTVEAWIASGAGCETDEHPTPKAALDALESVLARAFAPRPITLTIDA